MSINRVITVGNLVRDAELKYTNSGMAICNFSIAVSEYQGKDKDNWTNYFDCVLFAKRAEALNQYLVKGQKVVVEGNMHQDRWESENGNRSKIQIKVSDLELVGGKKSESKHETPVSNKPEDFESDIPF